MPIATINPATNELVKTFTGLSDEQVDAKIAKAATTFQSYRKTSLADRARWMKNAGDILTCGRTVPSIDALRYNPPLSILLGPTFADSA